MIEHLTKEELQAVMDLASVGDSLGIPLMLVGANARRLGFDIPFAFPSPRSTQDWDFAVPMQDWESFARFYEAAVEGSAPLFRLGSPAHRMIHQETGIQIDLVPFGELTGGTGQIRWPASDQVMSVSGFEEAFESCVRVTLPNKTEIRIVTPAHLVVLKLVAFSERGGQSSRDILDIWFILERYARPPANEARVYDEMVGQFPNDGTYYEHLHALLLGWDIGRRCRRATLAAIEPVLKELAFKDSGLIEPLLPRTGDMDEREVLRARITSEFGWVRTGIGMGQDAE